LCKEVAGGMAQKDMRAVLKAGAFGRNPRDYNYSLASTNFSNPDWRDGAGGLMADIIRVYCAGTTGTDPTLDFGGNPGDLGGGEPFPFDSDPCEFCDTNSPPLGGQALEGLPHVRPQSADPPGGGNRRYHPLGDAELEEPVLIHLKRGDRIRAVIAWDSCPGANPQALPTAPVETDIDLFLVKDNKVVYSSQSVNDVTEGFDVTITSDPTLGEGDYSIWWAAEDGAGCDGNGFEPFGWATAIWDPSAG
jgi:hypothetical protein